MTVRKQWLLMLISIAVLSIMMNSLVLSVLINRYFVAYTTKNYQEHLGQLVEFSIKALEDPTYTEQQFAMELEAHLRDPITEIKLYDPSGRLLAEADRKTPIKMGGRNGMMRNNMMNHMMGEQSEEVDSEALFDDQGNQLGQLNVIRDSTLGDSMETRMFIFALMTDGLITVGLMLVFAVIIGMIISKKMSRDLVNTANQAQNVDLGITSELKMSNVMEIKVIQQSLATLETKLKLKQKSRKHLLDELVHQTRTPLTILRTHLEGFEDGLIQMDPEEIKVCENQIENITSIIANMSQMIDAEQEVYPLKIEEIDVHQILSQILNGLKVQFEKKKISLTLTPTDKIMFYTDRYLLSQVIYNLLTNAYKFTDEEGKVEIAYSLQGNRLRIRVADTGAGIPDQYKERIFDAYYQMPSVNKPAGDGIGLYVVKENLKKIGGSIEVISEPGKGSTFILECTNQK